MDIAGEQLSLVGASKDQVQTILVVDDEPSIQQTLREILEEEGYQVFVASSGEEALKVAEVVKPALVLLDIWMPGRDGMEILPQLRAAHPGVPVVMMSGHATIQTAVQATRLGAEEFLEKPLDLHVTLDLVQRLLSLSVHSTTTDPVDVERARDEIESLSSVGEKQTVTSLLSTSAFNRDVWRGTAHPQRTLGSSAVLYGQGLHSGVKSGLILEPLPVNSGIHFVGVSSREPVPAFVSFVDSTGFATRLSAGETQISTIEHLLSALHAYGITNVLVKCNNEVPIMDGSSEVFCETLEDAGIVEQSELVYAIRPPTSFTFGESRERIEIAPSDGGLHIEYELDYPAPLGVQTLSFSLSPESYRKEISRARTFGFVKDIGMLQSLGLAQGGRFHNFVLYGEQGAINTELRYPDEAVRHKILDLIGDIYLLGRPFDAHVKASMTGHSDNVGLLQVLHEAFESA